MSTLAKTADELNGSEPRDVALPILVEELGGRLYSLSLRLCGNNEEAEDLVQETFMLAFKNWQQFEGRSKASTWLYTIATRACIRSQRKKQSRAERTQSLEELLPFGDEWIAVTPSPDDPLIQQIRQEAQERIEDEIASLPTLFRMPLVLRELAGLTMEEIATTLGIKVATVKTRLHRARLRLRKSLEQSLPKRRVPFPVYSRRICLDLLQAKQESLDNDATFEFPDQIVCKRCSEVFATMDLSQEICNELSHGELPDSLRREILHQFANGVKLS